MQANVEELLYIVNFENEAGYAILGADDRLEPVYAVVDEGSLTTEEFRYAVTVTPEQAEAAFRAEIEALQSVPASDYEVEKVKNKFEANTLFGELNVMNKAMNLGFYEMLGDLQLINGEVAAYRAVTTGDILAFSRRTFRPGNCSTLIYKAKK